MINTLEFHEYNKAKESTYPTQSGKYLVRYFPMGEDENHLPTYDIVWWKDDFKGFFFDTKCIKQNDIEKSFNYRIFGWAFLPNLTNISGRY